MHRMQYIAVPDHVICISQVWQSPKKNNEKPNNSQSKFQAIYKWSYISMSQSPKKFKQKKTVQEGKCPPITIKNIFSEKVASQLWFKTDLEN